MVGWWEDIGRDKNNNIIIATCSEVLRLESWVVVPVCSDRIKYSNTFCRVRKSINWWSWINDYKISSHISSMAPWMFHSIGVKIMRVMLLQSWFHRILLKHHNPHHGGIVLVKQCGYCWASLDANPVYSQAIEDYRAKIQRDLHQYSASKCWWAITKSLIGSTSSGKSTYVSICQPTCWVLFVQIVSTIWCNIHFHTKWLPSILAHPVLFFR